MMTKRADGGGGEPPNGDDDSVKRPSKKGRARGIYVAPTDEPADSASGLARVLHTKLMAKGWTQADLLVAMNNLRPSTMREIGRWTVSSYARGVSMPRPRLLQLMADALECPVTDLVRTTADVIVHSDKQAPADFQMLGNGKSRLRFDMELPSDVALKILGLVQEATAG